MNSYGKKGNSYVIGKETWGYTRSETTKGNV